MTMHENVDKTHKHDFEQKELNTKEYILCNSTYTTLNRKTKPRHSVKIQGWEAREGIMIGVYTARASGVLAGSIWRTECL